MGREFTSLEATTRPGGNNNTWCQDELNWFSWANCAKEEESLLRFFRRAICLRKQHGDVLARTEFMTHETIQWNHLNWEDEYNFISFILHRPGEDVQDAEQPEEASVVSAVASKAASSGSTRDSERRQCTALLVAFNAGHLAHECHLPQGRDWFRLVDTSLPAPQDIVDCDEDAQLISGEAYVMTPYSCIILRSFADLADAQRYDTGELEPSHAKQWEEELRQVASQPLESQLLEDDFEEVGSVALRLRSCCQASFGKGFDANHGRLMAPFLVPFQAYKCGEQSPQLMWGPGRDMV
eukprot:s673_g8.t1